MRLERSTAGEGPPLIIAHGLFGSGRNWGAIAKRLSDIRQVVSVDMRNHGLSPWSGEHSYAALAEDLAEVAADLGGAADVLGHSMGGKAAMMLALTRPEAVRRLVVVDIAPVAYAHSQGPLIEAMRSVDLSRVERRSQADEQLAQSVNDPGARAFLLQSLDIPEKCWRLNLDVLADRMDEITGWPGVEGRFEGPTLVLTGARSDYVTEEEHAAVERHFPQARFETVEDAGHWVHAEQPRAVEAAVRAFLV